MNSSTTPLDWTRLVTPGHTWVGRLRRLTPLPIACGVGLILTTAWVVTDSTAGNAERIAEAQRSEAPFSFTERLRVAPVATLTGRNVTEASNPLSLMGLNWDALQVTFAGDADSILSREEYVDAIALNLRALEVNDALPPHACSEWSGRAGPTSTPLVCRKADDAVFVFGTIASTRSFLHVIPAPTFGVYFKRDDEWAFENVDAPGFQPIAGFGTIEPRFIPSAMTEAFPELVNRTER